MSNATLPRATLAESLGVLTDVLLPNVAKGPLLRRPKVVAAAERLQLDRRGVERLQRLRDHYGDGPLLLSGVPGREQGVVLDPATLRRVLDETPDPFAAASSEKRAALAHFQPEGVLATRGPERAERRRYNDAVLDSSCPRHAFAARFQAVVQEEAAQLLAKATRGAREAVLSWNAFAPAWWRAVRRVVLGDGARDDSTLTDMLQQLRSDANLAFLWPKREVLRGRFDARLAAHLARAEPGSLAAMIARTPAGPNTDTEQQVPQWLFAFDATGIATFRALALLAAHADYGEQARWEALDVAAHPTLPLLRAAVLESVRLWPTTPMILRQTTAETVWEKGTMPAGTGLLILVPFFCRDGERLAEADRFAPELWLDAAGEDGAQIGERAATSWPLIPFSAGPAFCPGRHLALLMASTMLGALVRDGRWAQRGGLRLDARRPMPATFNNFALRFARGGGAGARRVL